MTNLVFLIQDALMALRANALRSLLTLLGVIIGVASVVTMVSIGDGAKHEIDQRINSLGSTVLTIRPGASRFGGRQGAAGSAKPFDDADVLAIKNLDAIVGASGRVNISTQVVSSGQNWQTTAQGVHTDYLTIHDWRIIDGRAFSEREVSRGRKLALIGKTVSEELFGVGISPIGERVRIKNIPFQIIGLLAEKGAGSFGNDEDDVIMVPISAARKRLIGRPSTVPNYVTRMTVRAADDANLEDAEAAVRALLQERRDLAPGAADDFVIYNFSELIAARAETQRTLTALLATMAGVSLLVGGIGIMNIMLVSVTERTREIGLRLAMGARGRDIQQQFLIEAVTLSVIGGSIGILIGIALSWGLSVIGQWPVLISSQAIILAVAFSVLVGVFFGFYPARKASRLNPIDALRSE